MDTLIFAIIGIVGVVMIGLIAYANIRYAPEKIGLKSSPGRYAAAAVGAISMILIALDMPLGYALGLIFIIWLLQYLPARTFTENCIRFIITSLLGIMLSIALIYHADPAEFSNLTAYAGQSSRVISGLMLLSAFLILNIITISIFPVRECSIEFNLGDIIIMLGSAGLTMLTLLIPETNIMMAAFFLTLVCCTEASRSDDIMVISVMSGIILLTGIRVQVFLSGPGIASYDNRTGMITLLFGLLVPLVFYAIRHKKQGVCDDGDHGDGRRRLICLQEYRQKREKKEQAQQEQKDIA